MLTTGAAAAKLTKHTVRMPAQLEVAPALIDRR
jgi:hypothetical protein